MCVICTGVSADADKMDKLTNSEMGVSLSLFLADLLVSHNVTVSTLTNTTLLFTNNYTHCFASKNGQDLSCGS